jgi:hypothetical protein
MPSIATVSRRVSPAGGPQHRARRVGGDRGGRPRDRRHPQRRPRGTTRCGRRPPRGGGIRPAARQRRALKAIRLVGPLPSDQGVAHDLLRDGAPCPPAVDAGGGSTSSLTPSPTSSSTRRALGRATSSSTWVRAPAPSPRPYWLRARTSSPSSSTPPDSPPFGADSTSIRRTVRTDSTSIRRGRGHGQWSGGCGWCGPTPPTSGSRVSPSVWWPTLPGRSAQPCCAVSPHPEAAWFAPTWWCHATWPPVGRRVMRPAPAAGCGPSQRR